MWTLTRDFHEEFYDEHVNDMPCSVVTVYRVIKSNNSSRKKVTWHSIRRDPAQQLQFLNDIAHAERLLILMVWCKMKIISIRDTNGPR